MLKRFIYYILICSICFVTIELTLRFLAYETYQIPEYSFVSSPKECFSNSSNLGIDLVPGKFEIDINNGLIHTVTHNADSNRICSTANLDTLTKETFILGGSYTYGTGINDFETFPYLLQQEFKNTKFTNYAVPGYGTTHALLQLKNQITKGHIPQSVIIAYATFHEERNQMNKTYQYKLTKGIELNELTLNKLIFPYFDLEKNAIDFIDIVSDFKPLPFRKQSATINLIEQVFLKNEAKKLQELTYSKKIILAIKNLCKTNNIQLIIADIAFNNSSEIINNFCSTQNIAYLNISPDFTQNGFRSLPYDPHPNKAVHKIYFEKMSAYLKSINFEN